MAGKIKTNVVQLGDSATATQNFVLKTNVDGTATLARGNEGATTQDILTINADGGVKLNNAPAFSAHALALQTVTSGVATKANFATEEYDANSNYDTTLSRFTATLAGYYQFTGTMRSTGTTVTQMLSSVYVNGSSVQTVLNITGSSAALLASATSKPVYLAIGDYVELYIIVIGTGTVQAGGTVISNTSNFSGVLVRAA